MQDLHTAFKQLERDFWERSGKTDADSGEYILNKRGEILNDIANICAECARISNENLVGVGVGVMQNNLRELRSVLYLDENYRKQVKVKYESRKRNRDE